MATHPLGFFPTTHCRVLVYISMFRFSSPSFFGGVKQKHVFFAMMACEDYFSFCKIPHSDENGNLLQIDFKIIFPKDFFSLHLFMVIS